MEGKRLIAHQGSAIYQIQYPHSFLAGFYESIGLKAPRLTYQKWGGTEPEFPLSITPYEAVGWQHGQYGFWFGSKFGHKPGMWLMDPAGKNLEGAPISDEARLEWLRWLKGEGENGKKFEHPKVEGTRSHDISIPSLWNNTTWNVSA